MQIKNKFWMTFSVMLISSLVVAQNGQIVKLNGSDIEVWLPDGFEYEMGDALVANDPEGKLMLLIYAALIETIEGTPEDYARKVLGNMFQDYKESNEPLGYLVKEKEVYEMWGTGKLNKEKIAIRANIIQLNELYYMYIFTSGAEKDVIKFGETLNLILENLL